jgi:hypothetical protein
MRAGTDDGRGALNETGGRDAGGGERGRGGLDGELGTTSKREREGDSESLLRTIFRERSS